MTSLSTSPGRDADTVGLVYEPDSQANDSAQKASQSDANGDDDPAE